MALSAEALKRLQDAGIYSPDQAARLSANATPAPTPVAAPTPATGQSWLQSADLSRLQTPTAPQQPKAAMSDFLATADMKAMAAGSPQPASREPQVDAKPPVAESVPTTDLAVAAPQSAGINPAQALSMGLSQERAGRLERGYGMEQAGLRKEAEAGARQAAEEAGYLSEATRQQEERVRQQEDRRLQQQEQLDRDRDAVRQKIAEMEDMKVDPDRYVGKMGTGQKIMNFLAIAVGGANAGARGGENTALRQLNTEVERDIDAQKAAIDSKQKGVANQQSLYRSFLDQYGNERQAEAATRMAMNSIIEMKLKELGARYNGPQLKAAAQRMMGELEVKKQKDLAAFDDATVKAMGQAMGPVSGADRLTQQILRLPEKLQSKALEEKGDWDGYQAATKDIDAAFGAMAGASTLGAKVPFSEAKAAFEANAAKIQSAVRGSMKGQGAITDKDAESVVNPLIPSATDTSAQIRQKQEKLKDLLSSRAQKNFPILSGFGMLPKAIKTAPAVRN